MIPIAGNAFKQQVAFEWQLVSQSIEMITWCTVPCSLVNAINVCGLAGYNPQVATVINVCCVFITCCSTVFLYIVGLPTLAKGIGIKRDQQSIGKVDEDMVAVTNNTCYWGVMDLLAVCKECCLIGIGINFIKSLTGYSHPQVLFLVNIEKIQCAANTIIA